MNFTSNKNLWERFFTKIQGSFFSKFNKLSNKATNGINNFSIRKRLIFFFLLVSLGPIIIIGFISYQSSKGAIATKIDNYSQKGLSQTTRNLESILQQAEGLSSQLIVNNEYNNAISAYVNVKDSPDFYDKFQTLKNIIQALSFSNKKISGITFIDPNNSDKLETRTITTMTITNNHRQYLVDFLKSKTYKKAMGANGAPVWTLMKTESGYSVVMVRLIKNLVTGEPLGLVLVFIDEHYLNTEINVETESDTEKSKDGLLNDFLLIIDSDGVITSSPIKENIGVNIKKLLRKPDKIQPLLSGKKNKDSFLDKFMNQEVFITYQKVENRDWSLLSIAKTSYLYFESRLVGWTTFLLGICFAIFAIFISLYIAFSISNSLNQVVNAMRRAENGDFTVRANIRRKDELGFLGASFDHMIERIGDLVRKAKEAIDIVLSHSTVLEQSSFQSAQTAESVAKAMEEITKGTMEQTNEAEKSSVKITDLAKQIEVVVVKAGEVEIISGSTRDLSVKSKDAVEQLIMKTNETDQITTAIIKDITDLNISAEEIRGVTDIISNISEQTNLLALNASIEAARAGDMGQGFAVVAEEVTKLAFQSREAAKSINNILKTIQNKTQNSSKTAEQAHQIIEEQRNAVKLAQDSFTEITNATGDIIGRIIFINHLIQNINKYKDQAIQSIVNISSVSEQTAASAEEVSASTEEQTALSEQVSSLANELRKKAEELAETVAELQFN